MRKSWLVGVAATGMMGLCTTTAFAASTSVTVQPGDTLWALSRAYGVSVPALEIANPKVNPQNLTVHAVLVLPSRRATHTAGAKSVTVQTGQTLWSISRTYGTSVQALQAANPGVSVSDLLVGTTLRLPASAGKTNTANSTVQQNMYWMEHVINAEAGGLPLKAQIAVGDVVHHRLTAGSYGNTVRDVVFQVTNGHYQFTSVANGAIYQAPSQLSKQAAVDVLRYGTDEVPGAMVFYNPAHTPVASWVRKQPEITQISKLVFAK